MANECLDSAPLGDVGPSGVGRVSSKLGGRDEGVEWILPSGEVGREKLPLGKVLKEDRRPSSEG